MANGDTLESFAAVGALVGVAFLFLRGGGGSRGNLNIEFPSDAGLTGSGSQPPTGGGGGGGGGSTSAEGPVPTDETTLPSGGNDALSNAAREYYSYDTTPSAPFGSVGQSASRAQRLTENISEGNDDYVVGL